MKKRMILFLLFALASFGAYFFFLRPYLTFDQLKLHADMLKAFVQENYALSVLLYMGIYVVGGMIALPIAALLTVIGGYLFGAYLTVLFATVSATLCAAITFLLTRYLFGNWLQKKYERALMRFNREIDLHGISYFLSVRLIAVVPFFLVNILAGLTRVSFSTFMVTTTIGVLPAESLFAFAGQELAAVDSVQGIFSYKIIGAFLLLAFLALLPVLIKKFFRH